MSSLISQLIKDNLVSQAQLLEAQGRRSAEKKPIQELLIQSGFLKEEDLFNSAKKIFPCPLIDLGRINIDFSLIKLLPFERAMYHGVLPLKKEGDMLLAAMSDPCDIMARDEVCFITHLHVKPVLCRHAQLMNYIHKYYEAQDTVHDILKNTIEDVNIGPVYKEMIKNDDILDIANLKDDDDSSFIKLVNKLLSDAVDARASDVHIEPHQNDVEVRYRIDGHLKSIIKMPGELRHRLAARIKILANLDIAEQRKAQDGRIKILLHGKEIDLRISVIPVFHGEKIVLRILDIHNAQFDLNHLGFQPEDLDVFKDNIHKPQGVILVTGPTGSGKTTTLYSALQEIKSETKNIVTIEDPIEYVIEGINQLQLNRYKDVTFANGLRSILRQDPDVILVGEIRDRETADIAFRASLTGHMVFSTLHTNNAASTITRLLDIGLEPYLIASSTLMFVAQRLVRLICPNCCEVDHSPDPKLLAKFRSYLKSIDVPRFYVGVGCEQCSFSGFYGRTSLFEILRVDETIKELIVNRASETVIMKEAVKNGMKTLATAGVLKVAAGVTTLKEVEKVVDIIEEGADAFAS
jgi:type IV pilus assembly protein PilB